MWLFTQFGFYSIVKKKFNKVDPPYQIRSRSKRDLENLIAGASLDAEVITTKQSDYRYRIVASQEDLEKIMKWQLKHLNYDNFKGRIGKLDDQRNRASVYGKVWGLLFDYFQYEK